MARLWLQLDQLVDPFQWICKMSRGSHNQRNSMGSGNCDKNSTNCPQFKSPIYRSDRHYRGTEKSYTSHTKNGGRKKNESENWYCEVWPDNVISRLLHNTKLCEWVYDYNYRHLMRSCGLHIFFFINAVSESEPSWKATTSTLCGGHISSQSLVQTSQLFPFGWTGKSWCYTALCGTNSESAKIKSCFASPLSQRKQRTSEIQTQRTHS